VSELPQLVIFDCDGVLVDSEPISNAVLAELLSAHGLPTTAEEALATYRGMMMRDVIDHAERRLGRPLPDGFAADFEAARSKAFRRGLRPVAGAAEAVSAVRRAGIAVCVATQGRPEATEHKLRVAGLRELFGAEALFSAYTVARGKPHPDLLLHAAARMGAEPVACVVVEDTAIGVRAGVAAGMRVLGFAGATAADRGALLAAGAEVCERLAEVPALIGIERRRPRAAVLGA
jgi:HAD superfamily hydrolase (TIGR01509 family)